MMNGGLSASDVAVLSGSNNRANDGMFGGDGGWLWIIVVFALLFGWGGNGFGGFGGGNAGMQGALTRGDLCNEFSFNDLQNGVRNINDSVNVGFSNLNSTICHQQYDTAQLINGVQMQMANEFRGTDNAVCNLGYQTQQGFNNTNIALMQGQNALSTQLAQCCCENRQGQADIKYAMAQNTCNITNQMNTNTRDIIDSQNAGTRAILDYLCQDKISTLQAENQSLKLAASQAAQNTYLLSELKPCPSPAYLVCNPYTGGYNGYNYNGYGNGYSNGCGCNSGCGCA